MNILAIDTCFDACSAAVGLSDDGRVSARFEPMVTGHAERLLPMIAEVIEEAGLSFGDLDRIAVTMGPGTFTGTRIAVAAARSLALASAKPLVATTSLRVMAEQVVDDLTADDLAAGTDIMIATDARRGELYVEHFRDGSSLDGPAVLSPLEAVRMLAADRKTVLAGSGALAVAEAAHDLQGLQLRVTRPDLLPDARFLVRLGPALEDTGRAPAPLYLRPADAKPQTGKSILRAAP